MTDLTKTFTKPSYNPTTKSWETTMSYVGSNGKTYGKQTYSASNPNQLPGPSQINTNYGAAALGAFNGVRIGSFFGPKGAAAGAVLGSGYGVLNDGYHAIIDTVYDTFNPRYSPQQIQSMMAAAARRQRSLLSAPPDLPASIKNMQTPSVDLLSATIQRQANSMYGPRVDHTTGNRENVQSADTKKSFDVRSVVDGYLGYSLNDYINAISPSLYSSSFDRTVQNQANKEEEEQAAKKQAHLDNYSKSQAAAHKKSQEAHNAAAKAVQANTTGAAQPTNPDFDAKHGLTTSSSSSRSTKEFGGKTGPTTGMLSTTDEKDVRSGKSGTHDLAGGAANDTLGAGPNSRNVGEVVAVNSVKPPGMSKNSQKGLNAKRSNGSEGRDPGSMSNAEVSAGLGRGKGNAASVEPALGRALGLNRSAAEIEASKRGISYDADSSNTGGGKNAICTELHRQGLMPSDLYFWDMAHAVRVMPDELRRGYHYWAVPYVRLMRKSPFATAFIRPFAVARAKQVAHVEGKAKRGSLLGKAIRIIGEPICYTLGHFCAETDLRELYDPGLPLTRVTS